MPKLEFVSELLPYHVQTFPSVNVEIEAYAKLWQAYSTINSVWNWLEIYIID